MTAADITGHPFGTNAAGYAERRRGRPADLTEAKRNMDRCVVGLLSDWETTLQVLNHWFPWIQTSSWAENKGENRPSDEILPEGTSSHGSLRHFPRSEGLILAVS